MELGLQVDLDVDLLGPVIGLEPPVVVVVVAGEARHDVLDAVTPHVHGGHVGLARVAVEALLLVLQMADDAVARRLAQAARGGRV